MNLDAQTAKDGAVVVLCTLVMIELRSLRPVLAGIREVLSALLERERIRSERKREPSSPPPALPVQSSGVPDTVGFEDTGLHEIMERQRRERPRSPAMGVRAARPGAHHDKGD